MRSTLLLALTGLASAHFQLLHPDSIHFDDATEDSAPCGGAKLGFPDNDDDLFEYHVGGESIATVLTHERSDWLIRVTTDRKAEKDWEQVFPIYTQSGLGVFCQPNVPIPSKYEGKTGIVSVVSAATDGTLYQCILAKFVSGTADEYSGCSNGSANGYFSDNDDLSALVGGGGSSDDNDDSGSSTDSTSSAPASTSSDAPAATGEESGDDEGGDEDDAAMSLQAWGFMSSLVTVAAMAFVGGALVV